MTAAILRESPGEPIPLVLVSCRSCEGRGEHTDIPVRDWLGPRGTVDEACDTCHGEGHVLVDEVFASDEILDHESWLAHERWLDEEIAKQDQEAA